MDNKKKILIADDDEDVLLLLRKILHDNGYEVQCLRNANTIVDGMTEWPDLFILDKEMAVIDGIAICKYLKLHKVARNIPIVMISGVDCRQKAKAAGVDCFIEKPLDTTKLLEAINQCLFVPH
jgi:CheY-like chemotaxis protein